MYDHHTSIDKPEPVLQNLIIFTSHRIDRKDVPYFREYFGNDRFLRCKDTNFFAL